MGTERVRRQDDAPMRSLVNWALLGLVIDRPSYAYELARRFEREYHDALSLSSVSHVYTAISTLKGRQLVEEVAGSRTGRQPKPHYRATAKGVEEYREWLVDQIREDRQRQRLFVLQLGALMRSPHEALEIIKRYEESCLEFASKLPLARRDGIESGPALAARLLTEESRLSVGAKLAWAQYAKREFMTMLLDRSQEE